MNDDEPTPAIPASFLDLERNAQRAAEGRRQREKKEAKGAVIRRRRAFSRAKKPKGT